MSVIESNVITKGGITILYGSNEYGINWGDILIDYLLSKLIINNRYNRIICLLSDRTIINIYESLQLNNHNKLVFISVDKSLDEILSSIDDNLSSEFNGIAVVVCSLSEMLLTFGYQSIKSFVNNISTLISNKNIQLHSIIYEIHLTLHKPVMLTRMRSLGNISTVIIPNKGTISDEIVCEVHSIRRSNVTNKVSEEIDMFKRNYNSSTPRSYITPIIKKNFNNNEAKLIDSNDNKDNNQIDNAIDKSANVEKTNSSSVLKQLVTFDSNDPEFDDDENPDDDLDL